MDIVKRYTLRATLAPKCHANPYESCWAAWSNLDMVREHHNYLRNWSEESRIKDAQEELMDMARNVAKTHQQYREPFYAL